MAHAVDSHPQKQKIIDALLSGESPESVSKWCNPYISKVGLWRYRRSVLQTAVKAQAGIVKVLEDKGLISRETATAMVTADAVTDVARSVVAAQPILARMAARQNERDAVMRESRESGDLRAYASLDRNDISATELQAKLTGALAGEATHQQVIIVIPSTPADPQPLPEADVIDIEPAH